MKTLKLQQNKQQMSWYDQQEVKQQRKASKQMRDTRKGKKVMWVEVN